MIPNEFRHPAGFRRPWSPAQRHAGDSRRNLVSGPGQQPGQPRLLRGRVLKTYETTSDRGSGITDTGEVLWVASTYSREILKLDRSDGTRLATFDTPGAAATGAHGLEWRDDKLWMAVPPSRTIYQVDP